MAVTPNPSDKARIKFSSSELRLLRNVMHQCDNFYCLSIRASRLYSILNICCMVPVIIGNTVLIVLNSRTYNSEYDYSIWLATVVITTMCASLSGVCTFGKFAEKSAFFFSQRARFSRLRGTICHEMASPGMRVAREFTLSATQTLQELEESQDHDVPWIVTIRHKPVEPMFALNSVNPDT